MYTEVKALYRIGSSSPGEPRVEEDLPDRLKDRPPVVVIPSAYGTTAHPGGRKRALPWGPGISVQAAPTAGNESTITATAQRPRIAPTMSS